MHNFNNAVTNCLQTVITDGKLASPDVETGKRRGRHTITVTAKGGPAYVGDKDVSAGGGIKLLDGKSCTIPVVSGDVELYCAGTVVLTEWF